MDQSARLACVVRPPREMARQFERILALCLGLIFFALVSMPVWGALWLPPTTAYIILLFELYWTCHAVYAAWCGLISFHRFHTWAHIDWRARYLELERPIQQILVVPNFKERLETLAATLDHLAASDYPHEQMSVVLAMEGREAGALAKAEVLRRQYAHRFARFWITLHPSLPNEAAWKGANLAYSLRQIRARCEERSWDARRVLVTTLDADAHLHPRYLAALAAQYLRLPDSSSDFFQGLLVLTNNIGELHAPIRAWSAFWTFNYLAGLAHYALMPMSTYSASLKLLEEIGYWDPRFLAEDGHIFFRAFFNRRGRVRTRAIYLTVGLNAVHAGSLTTALRLQYKQMVRWAWAVSNLPYIAARMLVHVEIPWASKLRACLPYVETLLLLPATWIIISFGVLLLQMIGPAGQSQILGWPLASVSALVLTPTIVPVIAGIAVSQKLASTSPSAERHFTGRRGLWQWTGWLLLPLITALNFGGAYIQAYARLLCGLDLNDEPTPK